MLFNIVWMMTGSLIISVLLPVLAVAQQGVAHDSGKLHSRILDMDRKYSVYLPPGYMNSSRTYPVLYLLHGGGTDNRGWIQQGELQSIADKAINEGVATPMIIVMPDAYTQRRGYYENKENWRYEDFFFEEFIPHIESEYRIRRERHFRAISGYSIGGKAAFTYVFHHPQMFAASCPLSAAADAGKNDPANNIISLIETRTDSMLLSVRWYIDCGDDDFLFEQNTTVRNAMNKRGIRNEFRVRNGGHNWDYWRKSLPDVLQFVSAGFREQ